MNTTNKVEVLDINLSERYVPEWKHWEIAREIISNAMDADDKYVVKENGSDLLIVRTNSVPNVQELKIIGLSQSRYDDKKIGQFGEGFKLASLAATRLGGKVIVICPNYSITSYLDEEYGTRVLKYEYKQMDNKTTGCEVRIYLKDICNHYRGRFIKGKATGPISPKLKSEKTTIFNKGIFVTELKCDSLFDWNLQTLEINRDRSMLDDYALASEVCRYLNHNMDMAIAKMLVEANPGMFECQMLRKYGELINSPDAVHIVRHVIESKYGEKVLIASEDEEINKILLSRGYLTKRFEEHLKPMINNVIDKADDKINDFNHCNMRRMNLNEKKYLDEFNCIMDFLNIQANIFILEDGKNVPEGLFKDGEIILNEKLLKPGMRIRRIGTFLHELGHQVGGDDKTLAFEKSLTTILGNLGDVVIKNAIGGSV